MANRLDLKDIPVLRYFDGQTWNLAFGKVGSISSSPNGQADTVTFWFEGSLTIPGQSVVLNTGYTIPQTKWEGTLDDWLDSCGDIFDDAYALKFAGDQTVSVVWGLGMNKHRTTLSAPPIVDPLDALQELDKLNTDFDNIIKTEPPKPALPNCTCGAIYFGARETGDAHSVDCPRRKA